MFVKYYEYSPRKAASWGDIEGIVSSGKVLQHISSSHQLYFIALNYFGS